MDSAETGMYLLPGEKEFLSEYEPVRVREIDGDTYLLCGGSCNRDFRPFACRIFPYYAALIEGEKGTRIKLMLDPRARGICPLVSNGQKRRMQARFRQAVRRSVRILMRDAEIKEDFRRTYDFLSEIDDLRNLLFPVDF